MIVNSPPLAAKNFLVNELQEFDVGSKQQLQPDKFENSLYLFSVKCMEIIGRSYMLIN